METPPEPPLDALMAAANLCDAEGRRMERVSPSTAKHWADVALRLRSWYLVEGALSDRSRLSLSLPETREALLLKSALADAVGVLDGLFIREPSSNTNVKSAIEAVLINAKRALGAPHVE